MPIEDLRPLNDLSKVDPNRIAVFQKGDRVLKYYDSEAIEWNFRKPNVEILKSCTKLTNVKLDDITTDHRIQCLSYDFVDGNHQPTSVKQFVGILETLHMLHEKNIVHSDVRLANMIFHADNSHLIDFDLADKENTDYPRGYTKLVERLKETVQFSKRKKLHDRHSVKYVIEICLDVKLSSLTDMQISLLDIIANLQNHEQ